jgi:hypothetical protein
VARTELTATDHFQDIDILGDSTALPPHRDTLPAATSGPQAHTMPFLFLFQCGDRTQGLTCARQAPLESRPGPLALR